MNAPVSEAPIIELGAVVTSHRHEDLIIAFRDALQSLDVNGELDDLFKAVDEYLALLVVDSHEESLLFSELRGTLDSYAPVYCYFGPAHGDHMCYGFFVDWEQLQEGVLDGDVFKSDQPPTPEDLTNDARGYSYWLWMSDHGNATLYEATHTGWVERWSVV